MPKREIKTIDVNGEGYKYIQETIPKTWVQEELVYDKTSFIQIPLTEEVKGVFKGSWYEGVVVRVVEEMKSKHNNDIDTLTIIGVQTEEEWFLTHLLYEQDGEIKQSLHTTEPIFLIQILRILKGHEALEGIVIQNSLSYIESEKYGEYLKDYKEPVNAEDTDLEYQGTRFKYGDTFYIEDIKGHKNLLDGDEELVKLIDLGYDMLKVDISEQFYNEYGIDVIAYNSKKGKHATQYDHMRIKDGINLTEEELVNKWLGEKDFKQESSRRYYKEQYESELRTPYYVMMPRDYMKYLLKQDNIKVR